MKKARLRQEANLVAQYRILKFQWFFITAIVLILVLALPLVFLLYKNQEEKQTSLIDLTG